MPLSQVQIIRSLGEALAWFEKELSWKANPAELRHLTGRIGELYAAMITRGQMAPEVNQKGYDVVSSDNERISVKTVTSSVNVTFQKSTFEHVDRVMVLRINVEDGNEASIEEIYNGPASEIVILCKSTPNGYKFSTSKPVGPKRPLSDLEVTAQAQHGFHLIKQYESGTIEVYTEGVLEHVAKPILRKIAQQYGVDRLNGNGNPKNTRTLGADVIAAINDASSV